MNLSPVLNLLRRCRISIITVLLLGAAALVALQDTKGMFLLREISLQAFHFGGQEGKTFRVTNGSHEFHVPPRLQPLTAVFENGKTLPMQFSSQTVIHGPPGQYAWDAEDLWISPKSGKPENLVIRQPVSVPWWLRLLAYGAPVLGVWGVIKSRRERVAWLEGISAARPWCEGQLHPGATSKRTFPLMLAVLVTVLASNPGKPLWLDEFLHFCFAGYDAASEAWGVMQRTLVGINHGQTGVYMMADFWLLKAFGASSFAMRFPSLLSALLMMVAGASILKTRGFGVFWQSLAILALFAQSHYLMPYVAEARPYMPLAAATIGLLAYYLVPPTARGRTSVRLLGWSSVLLGTLMHPYFALYWLSVCGFSYLVFLSEKTLNPGFRSLVAHVNLPLSCVGTAVFFLIGRISWLRTGPAFVFNPFEFIAREDLWNTVVGSHFEFLSWSPCRNLQFWVAIALPSVYWLIPAQRRREWRPLIAPAILICIAVGLTALISYLSYRRNYWIIQRQWIASVALIPVAVVWLWGEIGRKLASCRHPGSVPVVVIISCLLISPALIGSVADTNLTPATRNDSDIAKPAQDAPVMEHTPEDWVRMANDNIRQGGPVWEYFQRYYEPPAGKP